MALLYIDGFDWIVNNSLTDNYQGRWTNTGGFPGSTGVDRITDTASGTGAAVRLEANNNLTHVIDGGPIATGYLGFRFRISSLTGGFVIVDFVEPSATSTLHLRLEISAGGNLLIRRGTSTILGTGTATISTGVWNYLEMKWFIHDSTGTFELRINDDPTPDLDLSSQDTLNGGTAQVTSIELNGNNNDCDYDDLYIDDAAFHGDVYVETISADGVGSDADFTPFVGANWQEVDELPTDNDTTYNESSTVSDRDRFTHTDLPADTDVVLGVQVGIWTKKDVAGPRDMRTLAYDGVTEGEGASQSPGTDYSWLYDMFEDHPTGAAAWTESEVNAGQFGYKVQA